MPPLAHENEHKPRVILYHQTHYDRNNNFVSVLPLLTEPTDAVSLTHLIVAAIHLNSTPGNITLNDDPPSAAKHDPLWEEAAILQDCGIKVLGMLGGAAKGTFTRLDGSDEAFEAYYPPLRDLVQRYNLDGLDLDVEEEMSPNGIIRLIDRLKVDFGAAFTITLAPVARALQGKKHLSGFDYEALEIMRGRAVGWYNVQFYNGWGNLVEDEGSDYHEILDRGWKPEKLVVGVLTHPGNGHGWVDAVEVKKAVGRLREVYPRFGGVMGWEYFNALMGEEGKGWEWAEGMMEALGGP
ncbi:MAG: hypothetical protein Q9219_005848 [cf. Caloplaca sp. 3 TL-2023]